MSSRADLTLGSKTSSDWIMKSSAKTLPTAAAAERTSVCDSGTRRRSCCSNTGTATRIDAAQITCSKAGVRPVRQKLHMLCGVVGQGPQAMEVSMKMCSIGAYPGDELEDSVMPATLEGVEQDMARLGRPGTVGEQTQAVRHRQARDEDVYCCEREGRQRVAGLYHGAAGLAHHNVTPPQRTSDEESDLMLDSLVP